MSDDNLPAKFHLHPFSRFAGIHVSVQFGAKTQGWATFRRKFGEEGVNRRQLRLVRWLGEDWGYHMEEKRPDVVTSFGLSTVQCTSVTDGQTDMPLAKYTVEQKFCQCTEKFRQQTCRNMFRKTTEHYVSTFTELSVD